ncbi:MAG: hypothetical protein K2L88_04320 [Clostridiales bacterium]|nr:hypothetical protein [Clostridiales bacterium]
MANKLNNILSGAEIATITTLQFIKIALLEEKARLQRKGAALEEPDTGDEPEECDYNEQLIEGTTVTFDQLLAMQIEAPLPVEELIENAEKLASGASPSDMIHFPPKKPANLRARCRAWFTAWTAWKVRKRELEHEHERTKADVVNMCYGIDFAIKLIDREIERQRSGDAIKVGDRFLCQG